MKLQTVMNKAIEFDPIRLVLDEGDPVENLYWPFDHSAVAVALDHRLREVLRESDGFPQEGRLVWVRMKPDIGLRTRWYLTWCYLYGTEHATKGLSFKTEVELSRQIPPDVYAAIKKLRDDTLECPPFTQETS